MDRFKKLKKEKSAKASSKEKQPLFITDVKSIKENLKIKEILRTVKMNSSMRLKAPPGSKVMNNKDFTDESCFEETSITQNSTEPLSATNPDVIYKAEEEENEINSDNDSKECTQELKEETGNAIPAVVDENMCNNLTTEPLSLEKSTDYSTELLQNECDSSKSDIVNNSVPDGKTNENNPDRKLSLDHSILSRREGLSQSELDLHSIGKSPLERKSSFFRKTMDSFVRNTTEMFKKQNKSLQRRVTVSVSLQSLNDKSSPPNDYREVPIQQVSDALEDSISDLQTPSQIARSNSSLSTVQRQSSEQSLAGSFAGSQPALHALSSSNLENVDSSSVHSFNEALLKEAMLNSRAISMSSGLDSPFGHPRRKASRSNRVTWVASEGLTNYLRRVSHGEKSKEMQSCQSYQDFSCIPENEQYSRKPDTKGRRLSYQRAVSGEDPVMPARNQDSALKKKHHISENCEVQIELAKILVDFTRHGVPPLQGFEVAKIPDEAFAYLLWATSLKNITATFDWKPLSSQDQARQAAIRELINTEAEHIRHLMSMLEIFMAAAHSLQNMKKLLKIDTAKVFSNMPDVLNASLQFWSAALVPMIKDAVENRRPFNTELMYNGFVHMNDLLFPYERYVVDQRKLLEYCRSNQSDVEFSMYLSWCYEQKESKRLQLSDFLAKPMQRLTKYSLMVHRICENINAGPEHSLLQHMEHLSKDYVNVVNNTVRQHEEVEKLINLQEILEPYESDLKDEDIERYFRSYYAVNLRAPMLYCRPYHSRCLIHQVNLRFRDGAKESDARVFLLTDMLLVCKRLSKGLRHYKLIRPKYMLDKLIQFPKFDNKNNDDLAGLAYIVVDDFGSSSTSFILSEMAKDGKAQKALRTFENKVKEAKLAYEMMIWHGRNPNKTISDAEVNNIIKSLQIQTRVSAEQVAIIQQASKRVEAMVHQSAGAPLFDYTAEAAREVIVGVSARPPMAERRTHVFHRTITNDSAHTSQWGTQPVCTSPLLHEEKYSRLSVNRRTASLEPLMIPTTEPTIVEPTPTITVHVQSEGETETAMTTLQLTPSLHPSPTLSRSSDKMITTQQTLRVQPPQEGDALIYSLPDLTIEPCTPKSTLSPTQPSASEKLYRSHQELLERNRFEEVHGQQFLSPDHRGASHAPTSPTRASLKRSLAFSYSFKSPSLSRMDHVGSQSPIQTDVTPSTSQQSWLDRGGSPKPGPSSDKSDKKSKLTSSRIYRRKQRDKSEDRQSEPCPSRRGSRGPSRTDEFYDPYRRGRCRSAGSSYRDESPGTSFKDDSTDLSFRDKSTSTSHRDESPATSLGYSYEKEISSPGGKTESLGISQKVDSLGLDQKDIRSDSVIETETPEPFHRIDSPDPFLNDQEPPLSSDSKSSDEAHKKENVSVIIVEESCNVIPQEAIPSHSRDISYSAYRLTPGVSASVIQQEELPSSSRVDPVQRVSTEQISISSGKVKSPIIRSKTPSVILEETSECSSSHIEIQYRKLSATQEDTDPGCSYKNDSSNSSLLSEDAESIKKDDSPPISRKEEKVS